MLVLSVASPSKSGTMARSTSSQLTCLSSLRRDVESSPTPFFPGVFASQEIFFQQHLRLGNPVWAAIWSVRCVAHRITPDAGHSVRRARDDTSSLPKGVHHLNIQAVKPIISFCNFVLCVA